MQQKRNFRAKFSSIVLKGIATESPSGSKTEYHNKKCSAFVHIIIRKSSKTFAFASGNHESIQ